MQATGGIDREALQERAALFLQHPQFKHARLRFCADVPRIWLQSDLQRRLIPDAAALGVVIAVIGLHRLDPANGASLALVIQALGSAGISSPNRVRAIVGMLEQSGALAKIPHSQDRRRLRLVPTDRLVQVAQDWLRTVLGPLSLLVAMDPGPDELAQASAIAERYVLAVMLRQAVDGFTIMEGWPEAAAFMNRRHGYLVMLFLAGHDKLVVRINRAEVARRCGVSTVHVASMLTDAERQGWLQRVPSEGLIRLDPEFAGRLDLWVARELALVDLWLEAKLPQVRLQPGRDVCAS